MRPYLLCGRIYVIAHTLVGQYISHVNHRLCNLVSRQIAKLGIMCNGKFRSKEYLIVIHANVVDTGESFVNRTDKGDDYAHRKDGQPNLVDGLFLCYFQILYLFYSENTVLFKTIFSTFLNTGVSFFLSQSAAPC